MICNFFSGSLEIVLISNALCNAGIVLWTLHQDQMITILSKSLVSCFFFFLSIFKNPFMQEHSLTA